MADQVALMMAGVVARVQVEPVGLVAEVVRVGITIIEYVHTASRVISVLAPRVGSVGEIRHLRMTPIILHLRVLCTLTRKDFRTMTISDPQKE